MGEGNGMVKPKFPLFGKEWWYKTLCDEDGVPSSKRQVGAILLLFFIYSVITGVEADKLEIIGWMIVGMFGVTEVGKFKNRTL